MLGAGAPAAGFDAVAHDYDADFSQSATGRLQRARVHDYLQGLPVAGGQALELGCGTGEDALFLAGRGWDVRATDASLAMLGVAEEKVRAARLAGAVRFERLDLRSIELWQPGQRFDLIFSDFGALNCLSPLELAGVGRAAARLLKPGGRVVLVVMPRFCLWEFGYFALRLRLGTALRRVRGGPLRARLGPTRIATWYHSPADLRRAFGRRFRAVAQAPVGLFLPPSYLDALFRRRAALLRQLDRLERRLGHGALAGFADHSLIDLQLETNPG